MKKFIIMIALVSIGSLVCFAQDPACDGTGTCPKEAPGELVRPVIMLDEMGTTVLENLSGAIVSKPRCDTDGNFYLRIVNPEDPNPYGAPILKFSRTGEKMAVLEAPRLADKQVVMGQFVLDPDSNVFAVARTGQRGKEKNGLVLRFDRDGRLRDQISLEIAMIPSAVVPFKSGDFLVRGMETSGKEPAPLTAIFDSSGKLLKRVTLPEEKVDNQALEPVSSEVKDSRSSVSLSWGAGSPSSDGNAYILSGTSPATVYIISPGGEVTRKLKVDPGDSEEVGFWIQESEGQLAVLFTKANQPGQIIKVLNSGTGKTVANYNPGPLGVGLGCFEAPDQFTFAAHRAGKLVLVRAQPAKD